MSENKTEKTSLSDENKHGRNTVCEESDKRMLYTEETGLGSAIFSIVCGGIGAVLSIIGLVFNLRTYLDFIEGTDQNGTAAYLQNAAAADNEEFFAPWYLCVIIMVICLAGFISGALSLRYYGRGMENGASLVATLVTGLIGTIISGIGLIASGCALILYLAIM